MPVVVFLVGVVFGTENFTLMTGLNMVVVGTGIAIASYGGWRLCKCGWMCAYRCFLMCAFVYVCLRVYICYLCTSVCVMCEYVH
jgi:hypothetical protein